MALRQDPHGLATAAGGPLRRSDPGGTGIRRRRCGRGFTYLGADAAAVKDPRILARIKALVIPPAWQDVWICADPRGHIQAIGIDAAGRRQYRYHDLWRQQRDLDKHDRVQHFGAALPAIREAVGRHLDTRGLAQGTGPGRRGTPDRPGFLPSRRRGVRRAERDLRPGHDQERPCDAHQGTARVRVPGQGRQAARAGDSRRSGMRRRAEPAAAARRRPAAGLPGRLSAGTTSPPRTSTTTSGRYPGATTPPRTSAPGTRPSWPPWAWPCPNPPPAATAARKRAIARVVQEVAAYLGNTPAVARASYIDPRVIDLYQDGRTIASVLGELGKDCDFGDLATRGRAEKAVLDLLASA